MRYTVTWEFDLREEDVDAESVKEHGIPLTVARYARGEHDAAPFYTVYDRESHKRFLVHTDTGAVLPVDRHGMSLKHGPSHRRR